MKMYFKVSPVKSRSFVSVLYELTLTYNMLVPGFLTLGDELLDLVLCRWCEVHDRDRDNLNSYSGENSVHLQYFDVWNM